MLYSDVERTLGMACSDHTWDGRVGGTSCIGLSPDRVAVFVIASDSGLCFLESLAGRVMAGLLTYSFVTAAFPTTLFRLVSGLVAGLSGRKSQQPVCRRIALRSLFNGHPPRDDGWP